MSGMPSPRSNFRRSGLVTGGCGTNASGSNPPASSCTSTATRSDSRSQRSTIGIRCASGLRRSASMALAHASVTARRRSSMRGSGSFEPVDAIIVTIARISERYSGRAGTSSSMRSPMPCLLPGPPDGVLDGRAQIERAVEARDLEHLPHTGLRGDDAQLTALGAGPLQHADEHAERRGIEEPDVVEVDHEVAAVIGEQRVQLLAEARGGGDVDLAGHGEARPPTFFTYGKAQIHDHSTIPDGPAGTANHPERRESLTRSRGGRRARPSPPAPARNRPDPTRLRRPRPVRWPACHRAA